MLILIQRYKNDLMLSAISLMVTFLLTILLDYATGWIAAPGLVYPPNTEIRLSTLEFDSVAHINRQGFRGPPLPPSGASAGFRIMALGDSFTYGWGVNDEAVWPAVLAEKARAEGCPAEVANLGWVGKGPAEYADLAEKAAPRLAPDLAIIGVLQGDDLQQLSTAGPAVDRAGLEETMYTLYPNISGLIQQLLLFTLDDFKPVISGEDIRTVWQGHVKGFRNRLPPASLARFEALDPEIQQLYQDGLINPHAVNIALYSPDYFLEAVDLTNPASQARINNLSLALARIERAAADQGATTVVAAIPHGIYVSQSYMENSRRLGYRVDPRLLTSSLPDAAVAQAAGQAGIKFLSALDAFRQSQKTVFFALDGHFTPAGHELFAENLLPVVMQACQSWRQDNQ